MYLGHIFYINCFSKVIFQKLGRSVENKIKRKSGGKNVLSSSYNHFEITPTNLREPSFKYLNTYKVKCIMKHADSREQTNL
jgi:hypothetical protein